MQRLAPSRPKRGWKIAAVVGLGLLLCFWLAALPLPGPLARAREGWWRHSAERRARVDFQQAHGWPDDPVLYPVRGSLHLQQTAAPPLNFAAASCQSGERRMFFGVTLADAQQPSVGVRIVLPETGSPRLTLTQAGRDDLVFNQQSCSAWDVAIDGGSSSTRSLRSLRGHARFACATEAASVAGDLSFRDCH